MDTQFPPPLVVGSRVWTSSGYHNHGPMEGPKINIAPNMGGTISGAGSPYYTDSLLYTIKWDNGQTSKHYSKELCCIGRFQSWSEFAAAIHITGSVEVTLGPQGGFRHAKMSLTYDGVSQDIELYNRELWIGLLESMAQEHGATINTTKLPPKPRQKRFL